MLTQSKRERTLHIRDACLATGLSLSKPRSKVVAVVMRVLAPPIFQGLEVLSTTVVAVKDF